LKLRCDKAPFHTGERLLPARYSRLTQSALGQRHRSRRAQVRGGFRSVFRQSPDAASPPLEPEAFPSPWRDLDGTVPRWSLRRRLAVTVDICVGEDLISICFWRLRTFVMGRRNMNDPVRLSS
jgi:hypothetical protein